MNKPRKQPLIAVSMGDPSGIGPEICLRLIRHWSPQADYRPVIIGDSRILAEVADRCRIPFDCDLTCDRILPQHLPEQLFDSDRAGLIDLQVLDHDLVKPGQVTRGAGEASFQYVDWGIDLVRRGQLNALVTAPIHKESWKLAGIPFPGHTEMLADRTRTQEYCMTMWSPAFSCSLVTTHIGFGEVISLLSTESILKVTRLTDQALRRILGRSPQLVMLGLNPHAGEGGLFGNREEESIIGPATEMARQEGIQISDPLPADTAFIPSIRQKTDGYICMYHDQGLIPFKAFNFDSGVNITLGLPIIRTSVDHGTAFDIAWQGLADWSSLRSAVELAARLAG
jgi:4-hydroxythreonine-4-phosphate dehydrogenase